MPIVILDHNALHIKITAFEGWLHDIHVSSNSDGDAEIECCDDFILVEKKNIYSLICALEMVLDKGK